MKTVQSFAVIALLTLGLRSFAQDQEASVQNGHVEFTAVGKPAMLKIHGKSLGPTGKISVSKGRISGVLKLELKGIATGIDLRDEHMKKKYLQVDLFPVAELLIKDMDVNVGKFSDFSGTLKDQNFTGDLTLHGVRKSIHGVYEVQSEGSLLKIHATYQFKLSDFNIEIPSYAGIKVADSVTVETSFEVPKK